MSIQQLEKTPTTTINNYNRFQADELVEHGNYQQSCKQDSGTSRQYCGPNIGVRNRRETRNSIKVQIANGKI